MILVTGASGFVGREVCMQLRNRNVTFRAAVRELNAGCGVDCVAVGDIDGNTDWNQAVIGCDTVIHLAGRAHVLHDDDSSAKTKFQSVNVDGTVALAKAAIQAGVKRFIFVSSIGVLGNSNSSPFDETSEASPEELYAQSKLMAERALSRLCEESGIELIIVRPPLVYGPGNPGNFNRLLRLISMGMPLPFGRVKSLRSFVYVGNLADFLCHAALYPEKRGGTYVVSDGDDVAFSDLVSLMCKCMGKGFVYPFPVFLIRLVSRLLGKGDLVDKLFASLTVSSALVIEKFKWRPPFTLKQGVALTVDWYMAECGAKR